MKETLNLTIDSELKKEAKIYAIRNDTSISQLVTDFLEKLVKK